MRIIKIGAVWCPSCLVMRSVWKKVLTEIKVDIEEYDYDVNYDVIEKYNVGIKLPVVIMLDDNNNEVKRIIGEKSKDELLMFLKEE
ncbi:MAG: thioredoxin family protein [Bacilli bacterium]